MFAISFLALFMILVTATSSAIAEKKGEAAESKRIEQVIKMLDEDIKKHEKPEGFKFQCGEKFISFFGVGDMSNAFTEITVPKTEVLRVIRRSGSNLVTVIVKSPFGGEPNFHRFSVSKKMRSMVLECLD